MSNVRNPGNCEECRRPINTGANESSPSLDYGGDSKLTFCSKRCRRDYLDGLPPGSLIAQSHADSFDVTPWGVEHAD